MFHRTPFRPLPPTVRNTVGSTTRFSGRQPTTRFSVNYSFFRTPVSQLLVFQDASPEKRVVEPLNLRSTTSQKGAVVPRRARI